MTDPNYTDADRADRLVREALRLLREVAPEFVDDELLDAIEALEAWLS